MLLQFVNARLQHNGVFAHNDLVFSDRQRLIAVRALLYRCEVAAFVVNLRLQTHTPIRRRHSRYFVAVG